MMRLAAPLLAMSMSLGLPAQEDARPNILFAIADDWGWPHAGAYGDAVVKTPSFDAIAQRGALFHRAFVSSPSCTPSRGAILTGQYHWRLKSGANLYGTFADDLDTYVEILQRAGYAAGATGKTWGPGRPQTKGRQLAGRRYKQFEEFLAQRDAGKPFVFWLGTGDPHRPYRKNSGREAGMDLSKVHLFGHYPDTEEVRSDVADYYFEVQRFDTLVGRALQALKEAGALRNTIVVMTGDHGMPFPRGKSNLYDAGTRVPLAVMWPARWKAGQVRQEFVSLTDLAPTFLSAAGLDVPAAMTGRSLAPLLEGKEQEGRDEVFFGKERHVPCQEAPDMGGYPCRAIRTEHYLYIRNFEPDRWPNGTPDFEKAARKGTWLGDTDNGPTKTYIVAHKDDDDAHRRSYALCFGKRPAEELYDLRADPGQLIDVAKDPEHAEAKKRLAKRLEQRLKETGDPRIVGGYDFDAQPYSGGSPRHPSLEGGRRRGR